MKKKLILIAFTLFVLGGVFTTSIDGEGFLLSGEKGIVSDSVGDES
jgi:hypothetical protein